MDVARVRDGVCSDVFVPKLRNSCVFSRRVECAIHATEIGLAAVSSWVTYVDDSSVSGGRLLIYVDCGFSDSLFHLFKYLDSFLSDGRLLVSEHLIARTTFGMEC